MRVIRNGTMCPFCGSTYLRRYTVEKLCDAKVEPAHVHVVECRLCISAWQWPGGLTESETQEYYQNQYSPLHRNPYYDPDRKKQTAQIQLDFVSSCFGQPGSLLDVGAGAGAFVELARSIGWRAQGIDLSVSSEFVAQGTIEDVNGHFDVITMWDVIEHVEDPESVIRMASTKLTDNGVLIIETGNYLSTDRILNEPNWWAFHPDHRWYHSPGVIEGLLRKSGLGQIEYAKHNLRPNAIAPDHYLGPSITEFVMKALKRPHRITGLNRQYSDLKVAARNYPNLASIGIFALAARK